MQEQHDPQQATKRWRERLSTSRLGWSALLLLGIPLAAAVALLIRFLG
jgi:hypothetical protein